MDKKCVAMAGLRNMKKSTISEKRPKWDPIAKSNGQRSSLSSNGFWYINDTLPVTLCWQFDGSCLAKRLATC